MGLIMKGKIGKRTWTRILAALFCLSLGLPATLLGAAAAPPDSPKIVEEVRAIIKYHYPLDVPSGVDKATTIKGMLEALGDPYAQYMTAKEYTDFIGEINRTFVGVGVFLEAHPDGILVRQVFSGTPAQAAGLLAGDVIVAADGKPLKGLSPEAAANLIRGEAGSGVTLKWRRGGQEFSQTLIRAEIQAPLVEGELVGTVGYIALYSFGDGLTEQFEAIVKELRKAGAKTWLIDLTYNGGGIVDEALTLLGCFIGEKEAVTWKMAGIRITEKSIPQETIIQEPVILLTNNYTASASEIVTGALKDHRAAAVLGEQTYGSGRFKSAFRLSNGDFLYMTITQFYSPYNIAVDAVGLAPHVKLNEQEAVRAGMLLLKSGPLETEPAAGKPPAASTPKAKDETGYLRVMVGPQLYRAALSDWQQEEYWGAGQRLLDAMYWTTMIDVGTADGWRAIPEEYLKERWRIYYPGYTVLTQQIIASQGSSTIKAILSSDLQGRLAQAQLIDALSGQRIQCAVEPASGGFKMTPSGKLAARHEYWLVIPGSDGKTGGIAIVRTRD